MTDADPSTALTPTVVSDIKTSSDDSITDADMKSDDSWSMSDPLEKPPPIWSTDQEKADWEELESTAQYARKNLNVVPGKDRSYLQLYRQILTEHSHSHMPSLTEYNDERAKRGRPAVTSRKEQFQNEVEEQEELLVSFEIEPNYRSKVEEIKSVTGVKPGDPTKRDIYLFYSNAFSVGTVGAGRGYHATLYYEPKYTRTGTTKKALEWNLKEDGERVWVDYSPILSHDDAYWKEAKARLASSAPDKGTEQATEP